MKTNTKKQIEQHGKQLLSIFREATEKEPIALCKKLRKIEKRVNHAATCLCNTNTLNRLEVTRAEEKTGWKKSTEEDIQVFFESIKKELISLLGSKAKELVFINMDPRGYALKIKDNAMRKQNLSLFQDWGGAGILAPDFSN